MKWLYRSCEFAFLDSLLSSILHYRDGIQLQVGKNSKDVFTFVPMLFFFALDTMEANELCGVNGAPMARMRCRMCKCPREELNGVLQYERRNGEEMMQMGIQGEDAFLRKCEIEKHGRLPDDVKDVLNELKLHSLMCIENPLHKYFDWAPNKSLFGVPHCMPFDALHTLNKGLVECVCKWVVLVISYVGKIDRRNYGNNVSIMDNRIKSFVTQHSVTPFGNYKFRKGISDQFNSIIEKDKDNTGTGKS